jgi:glycosyltransferase involved in cell wall biosynthesis/heme O synthase-like polyprenyltransferase
MPDALLDRWWKPKATNLLAVLYAVTLVTALPIGHTLLLLIPAIVTIAGIGTLGHLLNDWFDIASDAAVGKANRLTGVPSRAAVRMFVLALLLALLPWVLLPWNNTSLGLLALEVALLLAYACPPLRLKLRQRWAVVVDGAYAYAIPAALAAYTFFLASERHPDRWLLAALCVWQQALGMRHFLNHLALDRDNDRATATPTLATRRGNRFVHRCIRRWILPFECAGFAATLAVIGRYWWPVPVVFATLFAMAAAVRQIATGRRFFFGPYRFSETALDRTYQQILPLVLLAFLVVRDWRFVSLLTLHGVLFSGTGLSAAAVRVVRRVRGVAAITGAPRQDITISVSMPGRSRPDRSCVEAVDIAGLSIAIVNINKAKYTETFVHGAMRTLRCKVHYLHGGELSRFDETDRGFLPWRPALQLITALIERLLRLERDYFLKDSIGRFLQTRDVRLVLAHFGPVGARLAPVTRDLGIPLIVWFHGYDAFNRQTLGDHARDYQQLFRVADRVLVVSRRMADALREFGAPAEKLVHLPAFVDLSLFPFADHSRIGPRFLAVGRFAETKSPHLTILAFHRVVQRAPTATLTLVGKGGGGELFEACMILAQALGLVGNIEFKGVLSHAEVAAEMRDARVFVQHSVTTPQGGDMEGKPVAIMEAMASGLPVVATRHSGIVELIDDGVTGFLVDECDVGAMAEAMLFLIGHDEMVREVGENASRRVHEDPLIRDHVPILERIIGEGIARNEPASTAWIADERGEPSHAVAQAAPALRRQRGAL